MSVLLWTEKQDVGPQARLGAAAVYDATRGRVVLFGGSALSAGSFADTWEWDGADWTQVADTGPDARSGHDLAFDSGRSRVVLFGGRGGDGTLRADTWEWDGENWTQTADAGPDARTDLRLAFDSSRSRTVLFGGLAAGDALRADTWLWNGQSWTQAQDTGPSSRHAHAMTFDAARSAVVLFGGEAGATTSSAAIVADTWGWDGTAWTQRAHFGPPASAFSGLVFDGTICLLYGGIVSLTDPNAKVLAGSWQWDGVHWTQRQDIGPGPRFSFAMAFDAGRGCAALFGGLSVSEQDKTAADHLLGDTWEEQGSGPAAQVSSLTASPDTVAAGDATTIDVGLSQRAPAGGAVVALSGTAALPPVDVPAGATAGSASYTVPANTTPGDLELTAQLAGSSATTTLHVVASGGAATIATFTVAPTTMPAAQANATITYTVTLTAPAAAPVNVAISYQSSAIGTLTIAQGATSGQLQISVSGVPAGTYTFDATLGSQDLTATLTVA